MNKDKRCIVAEGSVNGQTNATANVNANANVNIMLHYSDEDVQKNMKENCCVKFYHCLKGSSSYRDMKVSSI